MKNRVIDFVLPIIVVSINILLSISIIKIFIPLSKGVFYEYHVLVDFFLFFVFYILLSGFVVRVFLKLKPLREGDYPMVGKDATYWKLITSVTELGGMFFLPFIPLFWKPAFFWLFGAKVGRGVEIAGKLIETSLIELEDYAFVGGGALITAHAVTFDKIVLKKVKICKRATVGLGAVILPGVEIGENSIVGAGSLVPIGKRIPSNEIWGGVPVQKIKDLQTSDIHA